ncbi:hypothetical protein [Peribacillus sp. NPDC055009]
MKIRNPATREKDYVKGKYRKKFGRNLINFYSHIKNVENDNNRDFLESMSSMNPDLSKPEIIENFNLDSIIFSDIIFVEDFEKLRKGLHKLYKQNSNNFSPYNNPSNIDTFFNQLNSELDYGSWCPLFDINIKDKKMSEICKKIKISISSTTYSFVTIYFRVVPSEKFQDELNNMINSDADKRYHRLMIPRYIKDYFNIKKWIYTTYNKGTHKTLVIEDLFLELKWRITRYLLKELPLFFAKLGSVNPSIEVYKMTKSQDYLKRRDIQFASIGVDNYKINEINFDGDVETYFTHPGNASKDMTLKLLFNRVNYDINKGIGFDTSVRLIMEDLSKGLLQLLSLNNLTEILEKRTLKHKNIYDKINSKRITKYSKFSKLTKLRIKMEKDYLYVNRIKRDMNDNLYKYFIKDYNSIFFKSYNEWGSKKNIPERITSSVKERFANLTSLFENVKHELDNQTAFLNTIIDYKRQRVMLTLTIFSLLIALIALFVSVISI